MVMNKTSVADVKARLSEYLERVEQGERIVICRHNKPVAELVPVVRSRTEPRPLGPLHGRPAFVVGKAFDEPLSDDELAAWEGGMLPGQSVGASRASRLAERPTPYDTTARPVPRRRRRRS